uniref:ABC transmembrane type-1 domain-containing protein n=1 Tax=Panagrolaimus davidi TaxID=227884 RepID=A0A914QK12_9BILA
MFPFLAYYSFTAFVLGIISFFQFICFRHVALKLGRRFRRRYFQLLLLQSPEFYLSIKNKAMNERIEMDIQKLQTSFTDSLPTLITILMQFFSSFGMSFYLSSKLSIPISILGLAVFLFIFILTIFTIKFTQSELSINQESRKSIILSTTFFQWCNLHFSNGIKKSIIISLITGSLWLFMFGGMGVGALYGNLLIDTKQLLYPGYIFVIACTIIPACYRFGTVPLIWNNFISMKFAIHQILTLEEKQMSRISSTDSLTNFEYKRKEFLISFYKNEITGYHESLYPRNSDAFRYIQSFALRKCKLYFIAIFFAAIFAAAPPSFTKLNGDLFEFYKGNDSKLYFEDGIHISHRYYELGTIFCIAGFLSALFFGINGERIALHLRKSIYESFVTLDEPLSDSKKTQLVSLLTKSTTQCKSAFDISFCQFCVGFFSLIFGICFIFEKNFSTAFVSSVCFFLQAIIQYFVSRVAEIQTKRVISKRNQNRQEELDEFRKVPEISIEQKLESLNLQYSKYLHSTHHRLSSVIGLEALKFFALTALPQITQAISYILCCFLTSEGYVRPVVVYK